MVATTDDFARPRLFSRATTDGAFWYGFYVMPARDEFGEFIRQSFGRLFVQ